MDNSSELQIKLILPWTNHIYIEYDLTVKWPPSVKKKIEPKIVEKKPESVEPSTSTSKEPEPITLDTLNIFYTVSVKGRSVPLPIICIYLFIDMFIKYRSI